MAAPMEARLRNRETLKQLYPRNNSNELKEKAPPKSAKQRAKEYWERLKQNTKEYSQKLESQRERSRQDRDHFKATATDEEKERRRAANNERVRRYRERQKAAGTVAKTHKTSAPLTRKQKEQEAEKKWKDKERKREERKNWSAQKRSAENKKARDRYHKRLKAISPELQENSQEIDSTGDQRSKAARVQAVVRLTKSLPKDPAQKQTTIEDFVKRHKSSSTNKSDQSQSITSVILSNKGLTTREQVQLKRLLAKKMQYVPKESAACKELKLRKSQIKALSLKADKPLKRPKSQFLKNISDIHMFFKENSRIMPLKRSAKSQARVLEQTLKVLHSEFLKCHPPVNFSTFCKYRPRNVKPQASIKFNQALCELCENIDLKVKAINTAVKKPVAKNKDDILTKVLCPTDSRYYKPACINRTCKSCGPKCVSSLVDKDEWDKEVELKQWLMKEVVRGGKSMKKKALVRETVSVQGILEKLTVDLKTFPGHNFMAKWQYCQFNYKKKNLGEGEVVAVLDFAENYRCSLQDEAQSAHWCYGQATMHPIVCYYKCLRCTLTTTESLIMISDDLTHDSVAVREFMKIAYEHLASNISVKKIIQFTDGCSSQYKSKKPFLDIERSKQTVGVDIERNFFGSRHGKNPSDGESAVVKNAAMRAVKARRVVIQTARDLYQFGIQNLKRDSASDCVHFKRHFFFVDTHSLQREMKKDATLNIPVLKGTRELHSIKAKDGRLAYRNATCFCGEEPCLSKEYVDPWKMCSMQRNASSSKRSTTIMTESEAQDADTSSHFNTSLGLSTSALDYLDELNGDVENLVDEIGDPIPVTETNVNIPSTSKDVENLATETGDAVMETETTINVPSTSGPQMNEHIFPGCWVAVVFPGKVERIFLAFVLEVDAQEALVKFCRRSGSHFIWPTVEDISWMPLYSLTRLEAPEMDARERMFLKEDTFEFA